MGMLDCQIDAVAAAMPYGVVGRVMGMAGLAIEASGLPLPVGSLCRIRSFGNKLTTAEVVGFRDHLTLLVPLGSSAGVARGDPVENVQSAPRIWCSQELLGRVLDGFGRPSDGGPPLRMCESRRIDGVGVRPLERRGIDQPLATGIRCIDGLHTCGRGQRMGIFSGPGVGKSTLMSSIARYTSADVSVVALIGERGREVQDFLANTLNNDSRKRCVVVASTSDDPPTVRVRAAKVAATVAEYFRDQGLDVLLMMDSITRMCQAQRQIGLSAREPPATRGYPPSVFAMLPELLERAGKTERGSITGFYTVLVEGDDFNEPIPDAIKGISDGHIWLSRPLANRGHFPAVDVLQSISRVRGEVIDKDHLRCAKRVLALHAVYLDIEDLVNIGAYVAGNNLEYDLAVQSHPKIVQFLQQEASASSALEQTRKQLAELVAWVDQTERTLRAPKARPAATGGIAITA